jgi:hypothetical protein
VGGDPYLDAVRAGVRAAQGDLEGVRHFARRAVEREPSLIQGHWVLVSASLQVKDYDETLARLKEIDQKFDIEFEDLTQVPDYAGFVKSPAYAKWLDYLKAKDPAQKQAPTEERSRPAQGPGRPGTAEPEADD